MKFTIGQIKQFNAINVKCSNCNKLGHFAKVCQQKEIHITEAEIDSNSKVETEIFLPIEYLEH